METTLIRANSLLRMRPLVLASALLLNGPQALKTVLDGINTWMETHEYESVAQLKGSMSQQNLPNPSAFARAAYLNALDSFTPPLGVRY